MTDGEDHENGSYAEIRAGWRVILGCAIGIAIGIMALPYSTAGLFIAALTEEFGWTRTALSFGPTILFAIVALLAPLIGYLADRISSLIIIAFSMTAVAIAFIMMSRMGSDINDYYAICTFMAVLGAGASTVVFARIVWANFHERRGLALGIVMTGNGITAILSPVLIGRLIEAQGWRVGYVALTLVILLATPAILALLRSAEGIRPKAHDRTPQSAPLQLGASFAEASRTLPFWAMGIAFFLGTAATSGMIVHMIPFLLDSGAEMTSATAIASLIGFGLIGGRLITGWLMDRFEASLVGAGMMLASAAGMLLLALGDVETAFFGAFAIGLCIGAELDVIGYLTGHYYGMRSYGSIYGMLYTLCAGGAALSPVLFGLSSDRLGSYGPGLIAGGGALMVAAVLLFGLPRGEASCVRRQNIWH